MSKKDLAEKAMKIQGKDYVLVKDRIIFLAENYEGKYSIVTAPTYYPDEKMWVVKAVLTIDFQNGPKDYVGHAQEIEGQGNVNRTSALENAETSAVGRACAMAGIGVIDSIASVDEIKKAENRAKAPGPSSKMSATMWRIKSGVKAKVDPETGETHDVPWMGIFNEHDKDDVLWIGSVEDQEAVKKYMEKEGMNDSVPHAMPLKDFLFHVRASKAKPKLDEKPF